MAKFTITFEDSDDAVRSLLITSEPSLCDLMAKNLPRSEISMAMYFALAAWHHISVEAEKVAVETGGNFAVGNLH